MPSALPSLPRVFASVLPALIAISRLAASLSAAPADRPNVLVILADDLG
ncbi:MAG: hypothetical protein RLZZ221_2826, partial [Verrucomicrobiota bacterium]